MEWNEIKEVLARMMREIRSTLTGIDILPSIGSIDVIEHFRAPCNKNTTTNHYNDLFEIMFPNHRLPRNFKYKAVKETFLKGGYYRHDFGIERISLISLNSIYFLERNKCMFDKANE